MKKIFLLLMLALGALMVVSCSKDDDKDVINPDQQEEQQQEKEDEVRYYVKYEATCKSQHLSVTRTYTFTTENGTQTIQETNSTKTTTWEGTYGPVKKGFKTSLKCLIGESGSLISCHARIYVSRDKEPFVIKAEGNGENSLNLEYTIDF
ncbi:MAG: hypothetical protein K6C10_04085 [Prevotella sp.]|nr:hypothetical protein [Prevotella sp.]